MSPKVLTPQPPGTAIRETTVTEVIPASSEEKSYDAIEYMEKIKLDDWDESYGYLYRTDPPISRMAGEKGFVAQFDAPFTLMDLQKRYGGGTWRIIVKKKNGERVADSKHTVAGPARDLMSTAGVASTLDASSNNGNGAHGTDSNSNTSKLIDAATNTEAQKAQVEMVKNTATEVIAMARDAAPKQLSIQEIITLAKELQPKAATPDWWSNPLVIAIVTKLVERVFANPFEQIGPIIEMVSKLNGGAATGDWKLAAAQAVPKVADAFAEAMHEMRMGAEVQAGVRTPQSEVMFRGGQAPSANTQPAGQPPAANPKVIEIPPPAAQGDPMETFERQFVELLANEQISGAQAAEILWKDWPQILTEIAQHEPAIILANAPRRPLIAPHAQNPRLPQFITDMIAWTRAQLQKPGA